MFVDVTNDMRIAQEEIFGPVLVVIPYEDDEDAIRIANKSNYGLSGAGLGMSSLYHYFSDQTELLLAVLEPVMATAEAAYMAQVRDRWHDEELAERTKTFVRAYHDFWARHSRLLHLRNSLADQLDQRMMLHRINSTRPLIGLIVRQMCDREREPGMAKLRWRRC